LAIRSLLAQGKSFATTWRDRRKRTGACRPQFGRGCGGRAHLRDLIRRCHSQLRHRTFRRPRLLRLAAARRDFFVHANLQSGRNPTVRLAKSKILVQMSISLFSKPYGESLQKIF
jgi:hypothetical protein